MKRFGIFLSIVLFLLTSAGALYAQDVIITGVSSTPVSCGDGSDGTISVTVSGGVGQYSYLLVKGAQAVESAGPTSSPSFTFTGHTKYSNYIIIVSDEDEDTSDGFSFGTIGGAEPIKITSAWATDIICNGANDGSITVEATGEQGNFIFNLTGPENGTSEIGFFGGLEQGDYTVTVTDKDGCPSFDVSPVLTITDPPAVSIAVDAVTDVDCYGDNTGSINITPGGGVPGGGTGYSYSWTGPTGFTSGVEDISNLEAGDYFVTVRDGNMCPANAGPITINQLTELTAVLTGTSDVTCNGYQDGGANMTPGGGTGVYNYSWDGQNTGLVSTDKDPVNLFADTYDFTLFDSNGCSKTFPDFATIHEPDPLIASTTHVDVDCFGAANGSIDLTFSGGTAPYILSWKGPSGFTASTKDLINLEPGVYSLSITDDNTCTMDFPGIVTILEPAEIEVSAASNNISCGGAGDGSINITTIGGVEPYNFSWSGPGGFISSEEDLSGLEAGTYNLSITDGNACTMNFPGIATITEPTPITATLFIKTDINCHGDLSGSMVINVSGGVAPLIFDWTNEGGVTVSTDANPGGLPAGTYSLTISDASGCSIFYPDFATLNEPEALISTLSSSNISCYGDGDGSIQVLASGGSAPYEYSRNGNLDPSYQPGSDFSGLDPGFYTIWTRDANSCVVSDTITITEPDEIQVLTENITAQNLCYGDAVGAISIDAVSGGVPPYLYSINNGTDFYPTNDFNNLPAGDYQTFVRDATGCEVPGKLNVITQPAKLVIGSYDQEDITSCFDALEGRITILAAGGTGTKSYLLNGSIPSTTGDFQNLPAGTYFINITDINACSLDTTVVITAPPAVVVDDITLTHVSTCAGDPTGAVSIAGSGGSGNISYAIDGGTFQSSGTFGTLLAGNHTLSIKDDNDCSLDTMITLTEPLPIQIDSETSTPITCAGAADGTITILASGGTNPLEYVLQPGAISSPGGSFTGLSPGNYQVTVNDARGCTPATSLPFTFADPPELLLDSVREEGISCNGSADGIIEIFVSGGTPPYEYSVDNKNNWGVDSIITGLEPGTYEVFARDANLCTVYAGSILMTDPTLLTLTVISTDIEVCSGDTTGAIDITGSGGTGILLYSLNGLDYSSSGTFINLPAGDYTAYVQDEAGCTSTEAVKLLEPDPVVATIVKTDATFGNLGSITITETSGGTPPYEYSIEGPGGTFTTETSYTDLNVGSYRVISRDMNGCSYEEMVNILDVLPLEMVVNLSNVTCFGENDGTIEMIPQDAEGAVEYSIDSGANFVPTALFSNLAGNVTYYLVARDDAGKVFTRTVIITEPTELNLSRIITPAECNAFSETGAIDISITGGTPEYSYLWSDGSTESDRINIAAGNYTLVTSDANNCTRTDQILVNSLVIVNAYAGPDTTICHGASLQLNGLGGHIPSWSPATFLSDPDIANPTVAGLTETISYELTISEETSGYGCFNTDTVTISVHPLTGLSVTPDTFVIRGNSLPLEASGGPFNAYRWEPVTGLDNSTIPNPVATPQQSTSYRIYAMNEFGCEERDSVFVEVIDDIMAYNVFTPNNGDDINNYFDIKNADRFPEIVVEVYSRWGDLLFQTVGYDDGSRWDGRARGRDVPMGTYYYVIIPYKGAKPITGNVTIIR